MGQNRNDRNATKEKAIRNAQPLRDNKNIVSADDAARGDARTRGVAPSPDQSKA